MKQFELFFSLSDHYIKSESCFSVEHHVLALKRPPTIRATKAHQKFKSPELGKYMEWRFILNFSWNRRNKANIFGTLRPTKIKNIIFT
jgi:hypothetical protein